MNGTLGRDKIWNDQIWSDIDKAVREEVGRIRVAQKVFPTTVVNNVLPIAANNIPDGVPLRPGHDSFLPFVELSIGFVLTQAQVDGEENMRLARSLARRAASLLASTEDRILFWGNTNLKLTPKLTQKEEEAGISHVVTDTGVTITNRNDVQPGFVAAATGEATKTTPVPLSAKWTGAHKDTLGNILAAVATGIAELNSRAQPGPYALFLSPGRYGQTFQPVEGQLLAPGDQINHIVTSGFYMVNAIGNDMGILVSLGGEPTQIVLGLDATTALTYTDDLGFYYFRTFERIQWVVQDGRAFQKLTFP
jgi:uncharacterized linocin/CFP29 family protein